MFMNNDWQFTALKACIVRGYRNQKREKIKGTYS